MLCKPIISMKGRFGAPLGGRCDLEGVRVASTGTWVAVLNLGGILRVWALRLY